MSKVIKFFGIGFGLVVAIFAFAWLFEFAFADSDAVEADFVINWDDESELQMTTAVNSPNGARRPKIASAPNGTNVMIVFNREKTDGKNSPYFVSSGNNGSTWSAPQPIFNNGAGTNGIQPSVDYDNADKAHAVWVIEEGGSQKLYYAQEDSWPNSFVSIKENANILFIDSPKVIASSSTLIDVVWVEQTTSGFGAPNVHHARSSNGGASWNSFSIASLKTVRESGSPDMLVSGSNIYLVWQEEFTTGRRLIQFSHSEDGGVSWSIPITISDNDNTRSAERPSILLQDGAFEVSYSERSTNSLADQAIRHVTCSSDCTNANNWSDSAKASGFDVGANTNNSEIVISDMVSLNNCSIISFHGTVDGLPDNNEIIFNTTSCEGGNWTFAQEVTPSSIRSLRPVMATHADTIYLAYTQAGNGSSTEDQIRFIVGRLEEAVEPNPQLFLPIIAR